MEAEEKVALMKKAYNTLILCLRDRVLREFTKETTGAGILTKLTSLYMTKSLANRLYLKKKLYTYYMSPALMLLTSLSSSYENFMETLLYGRESLTMKNVLAILNSRELKKRIEGTKEETGDGLYVRGRSDHSGKAHSGRSSQFKSRDGTGKLKCFVCHSEGHLKRDCPMKKSSGFVKKGKRDQDSDSSDDEGNAYFGEALVVVGNDEMTELVMDSGVSYHMTHIRDFLYDFKVINGGSVQLGDNRTCTIKGTGKVKIQLHDESSFILEDVKYVLGVRRSLISLGTREKEGYTVKMQMGRKQGITKHGGSKQLGLKQLGSKQVGFKQLGVKQVVFNTTLWLKDVGDKQPEETDNNGLHYFKGALKKVHLGYKGWQKYTVTGVPGQEGAEGNVAEKKKVKGSIKANLGKLLKYNAWSTRWSPV
ncbi:zinc finger, CCHC-type containing protein [Tanacetum coccineum]